eukprot:UN01331
MVPRNTTVLENQHWKLPNPQLKIGNIMKIQLTQKFDLDTQIRREVVQKSFKTFKLYVFNNITCIYDHLVPTNSLRILVIMSF